MRIIILVIVLSLFGCEKFCNQSHKMATSLANKLEDRWGCDRQKVYDFVVKPLDKTLCKGHPQPEVPSRFLGASLVCKLVYTIAVGYAAKGIANMWACNYDLVNYDLQNTSAICSALDLL